MCPAVPTPKLKRRAHARSCGFLSPYSLLYASTFSALRGVGGRSGMKMEEHFSAARFGLASNTHWWRCSPAHSAWRSVLGFLRSCRSRSQSLRTSASVAGQGHRTVGESLPAEVMFFTATVHCAGPRPARLVCVSSLLTASTVSTPEGPYIELHQSVPTHQNTPRAVLETCPVRPSYGRSTSRIGRCECLYEEICLPCGSGAPGTGCTSLHGRRGAKPPTRPAGTLFML